MDHSDARNFYLKENLKCVRPRDFFERKNGFSRGTTSPYKRAREGVNFTDTEGGMGG